MKYILLIILNFSVLFVLFSNSLRLIAMSLIIASLGFSLYNFFYTASFQPLFFVIDLFVILIGIILYKSCETSDVISHYKKRAEFKTFPMTILIAFIWGIFALGPKKINYPEWQTPLASEYALIALMGVIVLFMLRKVQDD